MPSVDGSGNLLSAGANYNAGDWATVGAETSLDLVAVANLNRGVDIGLGVEALARLDGAIRQYIAADVNGQAHAAARVRGQVQMPLDLFDEAGIAVRLQAIAEAAAGVQLAIGLSPAEFLAHAGNDPRLQGAPMQLLRIFLEELTVQGGVMAKAAASAMAYANLIATGSFIKRGSRVPGFTIAAEAGVGLKAGAGYRVLARFGVDDPRNLVRRSVDVAVDETLASIASLLPPELRPLVDEATVPLKIALRSAFELGSTLAENNGVFSGADQGKIALRCAQVGLEEMQRYVLERSIQFASDQLLVVMREIDFDNAAWSAALAERQALAATLNAVPAEPFEATDANRAYWAKVVADALNVAAALSSTGNVPAAILEPLAIVWCGAQLLMKSVERISVATARASIVGVSPATATAAFSGDLPAAPSELRTHINAAIGRASGAVIRQADAVNYLLDVVATNIETISPPAARMLALLTGKSGAPASEAIAVVLSNIGAFAPGSDGTVDAQATLGVLRDGLRTYVNGRLDSELLPIIIDATEDAPEIRIYLEEVLLSTLRTVTDTVFDAVSSWQSASGSTQVALRELCSSLLMRLFGRSVVVVGDVLVAHSLTQIQGEFRQLAASSNNAGGIAPTLANLTGLDRDLVADLVRETLEVCAETFGPMPDDRRARMRDLMYQMIDTTPPGADASTLDSLKAAGMVGNAEAAIELAQLLGEEIAGNLVRFIHGLLTRIATALLALLVDTIEDIQKAVEAWMKQLEDLARGLLTQLADLLQEINALQHQLDDAVDDLLGHASMMLGGFVEFSGSRGSVRDKLKEAARERALDALADFPGYGALPSEVRRRIRRTVRRIVNEALDDEIFDDVVDALQRLSGETADLLDDIRAIEPGDDLVVAISDIALDRIEDAIRDAFDGNPSIRVKFDAPVLGEVNLGRISVPMSTFISVLRSAIRNLGRFDDAVAAAAGSLQSLLDVEDALEAAEAEHRAATATKEEADEHIADTRSGSLDLTIVHPQPASAITGAVTLRLRVPGGRPAMLASDGLSHRRLFVWVNERELSLDSARTSVELPFSARPAFGAQPGLPVVQNRMTGSRRQGHPLTLARAEQRDAQRIERVHSGRSPGVRSAGRGSPPREVNAGRADSFGGMSLARLPQSGAFPPRIPPLENIRERAADRSVLVVEIDVPSDMLHEGINAIACTLVPGSANRRVERAVSFLHTPGVAVNPRRPIMPEKPVAPQIPPALSVVLERRGAAPQPAPREKPKPRPVRGNTWVAPVAERRKALEKSRGVLREELTAAAQRQTEILDLIASRGLRPRRPETGKGESAS